MHKYCRSLFFIALLPATLALASPAHADDEEQSHPLAIHMNQWLAGSREWTTPNPDYDADDPQSFKEFRVRWDWGPFRQQLFGKLFGVTEDGKTALFWNMYTTFNPGDRTVVFQQVGWNGAYIHGEHPVREKPLPYGEIERLDTTMHTPDGETRHTRHDNAFSENGSHRARVYELDENGDWKLANTWDWMLVPEERALGSSL